MPSIRPFRAIRPAPDKVHLIVSRSYISYDDEGLTQKLASNPYSFIHVINPDHGEMDASKPGSKDLFKKVRAKYLDFYERGYFIQDENPGYYVYRQCNEDGSRDFTGIICATAAKDYAEGRIKKHELTLEKREKMFADYLMETGVNAEPVLLSYPDSAGINSRIERIKETQPICDFSTTDTVRHTVWKVDAADEIAAITGAFAEVPDFYIADGHHRLASSARLTELNNGEGYGLEAPHDFFMSYLVPASQMHIDGFHRLVSKGADIEEGQVLAKLAEHFDVTHVDTLTPPSSRRDIHVNLRSKYYRLRSRRSDEALLDVDICSKDILEPIFGITDLRNDPGIGFFSGWDGIQEMDEAVNEGQATMAIALFPVSMEELMSVADRGDTMPPKSTWIEPKLRSALTIYSLTKH